MTALRVLAAPTFRAARFTLWAAATFTAAAVATIAFATSTLTGRLTPAVAGAFAALR